MPRQARLDSLKKGPMKYAKKKVYLLRIKLAIELGTDHGLTLAETARQLGVSTSAISKILSRNMR